LVSLALAVAFLVFLVVRFDIDLDATWRQVRSGNPWLLTLAVAIHYTTFIFRGARWRLLLQNAQGPNRRPPGVVYCSELTLLGWFANSVAWFRLGDAYRAHLYQNERQESFSRTVGTIVSERALDTVMVVALLLLSVPFLVSRGSFAPWTVVGIALALQALLGITLFLVWKSGDRLNRWLPAWMAERVQHFREGVTGSFGQWPLVVLLGLLGWLAEAARFYLVALALGMPLSLALVVFATLANSLLTLVPTPGGVGAVESGVAGLLVKLSSLAASGASALVLVDRAISYVSIILTGGIIFLARPGYRRRIR
jgi:uncharacterized protein (TIRG00374 family)